MELKYETVCSIIKTFLRFRRVTSIKKRRPKIKKVTTEIEELIKKISEETLITPNALKFIIQIEKRVSISIPKIEKVFLGLKYSFKRVILIPESRKPIVKIETRYLCYNNYLMLDEEKIVFFDEMGVYCSLDCLMVEV